VLMAAGVVPNAELAAEAGLETNDGIVVDRRLRTTDPFISAIGDCARFPGPRTGESRRLESVQNAHDQAKTVAAQILGGSLEYDDLPWFWTVQGAARLQIAGLASGDIDHLVWGDLSGGRFSVFLFRDGRLAAVESVNSPGDHVVARKLLTSGRPVAPGDIEACTDLKLLLAQ
jgi:3-phenylpropionate/trans-cinnamate dioxygenase ferredoxin reductase subunit